VRLSRDGGNETISIILELMLVLARIVRPHVWREESTALSLCIDFSDWYLNEVITGCGTQRCCIP